MNNKFLLLLLLLPKCIYSMQGNSKEEEECQKIVGQIVKVLSDTQRVLKKGDPERQRIVILKKTFQNYTRQSAKDPKEPQ